MKNIKDINQVTLGPKVTLEDLIAVARYGAKVEFAKEYEDRVNAARQLVEEWVEAGQVIYGVTTGFGALCESPISKDQTAKLQRNIILSHSTSVGQPFSQEEVRGTIFMILQNIGQGYSGVRLLVLELLRDMLNANLIPFIPREGSVGYLAPEAHLAMVLLGEGQAYLEGQLMPGKEALEKAGLQPIELASKEGLALISGTTSTTALGSLALWDMLQCAKSADIIGAMSLESSKGILMAFDDRVMQVRPHEQQRNTASNVRKILADSKILEVHQKDRVQDALSFRCIPQLHGAAKKTLVDARLTLETEMNACCDNPIIWHGEGVAEAISACNADSSYVGLEMDSASMAATMLAKMSERRNNRMIDSNLSGNPAFLIKNPGLNSGLMIPQYTQAGLLGDMRILATSSVIDNTPTCMNQEDYVAMGYNASKKAVSIAEKLEYILAIELLSAFLAREFLGEEYPTSPVTEVIADHLKNHIPIKDEDFFLYPHIEYLRNIIHSGELVNWVEEKIGRLE